MVGLTTAAQVWTAVHEMFVAQNRATIRQTRFHMQTLKKRDMSATAYFQKMKSLADTMASIGNPLTVDEIIDYILAGLGPQYGPLVVSLTIVNKSISLTDFYAYLLSFESMLEQQQETGDWSSSANSVAPYSDNSRYTSPRRQNTQNNRQLGQQPRNGTHEGRQPSGGGQQGGHNSSGRNCNNGGRFRPRCQVCRFYGHEALNYHNRFNESYNSEDVRFGLAVNRQNSQDSHWYVDKGVTDHLTNDLDRLTTQERYTSKDQIQVANGAGQGQEDNSVTR